MSGQVSVMVNTYRKLAFKPLVWFSSSQFNTVSIGLRNFQGLVVSSFLLAHSWHWECPVLLSGGKGSCQKT